MARNRAIQAMKDSLGAQPRPAGWTGILDKLRTGP